MSERTTIDRLIPAGAGSTLQTYPPHRQTPAHPRWRGEHISQPPGTGRDTGSSPLARGARHSHARSRHAGRLIPAGAGSTYNHHLAMWAAQAHPRWRGEHRLFHCQRDASHGSSPLARGAQRRALPRLRLMRLIPAGAGSTTRCTTRTLTLTAHPRWRGEHGDSGRSAGHSCGSSPLARGAR